MERTALITIILLGLLMAAAMSVINDTWRNTHFSDYHDDAEIYNRTALLILEKHSFGEEGRGFVGAFRRAPGYPIFLAGSYALLGKTPAAAFATQTILWILSLVLLWSLAKIYFPYPYRLLPSLFLALSWFIALQTTIILPELFTLFLLLLFLWTLERFFITKKSTHLLVAGAALAWFILIRPVALYGLPFMLFFLWLRERNCVPAKALMRACGIFLLIPFLAVGAWMARSIILLDTWQIQSGSYVVGWKSLEASAPWERVTATLIAATTGDIIADRFSPGYSASPDHYPFMKTIFNRMRVLDAQKIPEAEKERILYQETWERIYANPVRFALAGILGLVRQNVPLNHRAQPITHLFAGGTYPFLSFWQKVGILIPLRLFGYAVLALIIYGIFLHYRKWRIWGMVLFWILFYNLFYAFFTHNEVRYMLPLWPLYLLYATAGLMAIRQRYAARLRTSLSSI